jgi:hypothetical protein
MLNPATTGSVQYPGLVFIVLVSMFIAALVMIAVFTYSIVVWLYGARDIADELSTGD